MSYTTTSIPKQSPESPSTLIKHVFHNVCLLDTCLNRAYIRLFTSVNAAVIPIVGRWGKLPPAAFILTFVRLLSCGVCNTLISTQFGNHKVYYCFTFKTILYIAALSDNCEQTVQHSKITAKFLYYWNNIVYLSIKCGHLKQVHIINSIQIS